MASSSSPSLLTSCIFNHAPRGNGPFPLPFFPLSHVFGKNPFPSCCYTHPPTDRNGPNGERVSFHKGGNRVHGSSTSPPFSIPANDIEARQILIFLRIRDIILGADTEVALPAILDSYADAPRGEVESDST